MTPRRALLGGALCLFCGAASATTYTYQMVTVPNAIQSDPVAVNEAGTALGVWYDSTYAAHGFIFSGGTTTVFDVPKALSTYPMGIDAKGEIVGTYLDASHNSHGFLRTTKGKFTTVDLPNSGYTGLTGINDKGVAVGVGQDQAGYGEVFTYANGVFTTIIDNQMSPTPTSISSKGAVAGYYAPPHSYETAFLYANGAVTTLPITAYNFAASFGVNSHNVVVGQAATGGTEYGFIYNGKSKIKYVGPNGSTDSFNLGINDKGVIAGVSYPNDGSYNSVGYTYEKGVFSILSITGEKDVSANAINDAGQVLGNYVDANNVPQTFLATPAQ